MREARRSNYRVEVTPILWNFEQGIDAKERAACEEIAKGIKRHIDDAHAVVRWDTEQACEFCGYSGGDEVDCCEESLAESPVQVGEGQ